MANEVSIVGQPQPGQLQALGELTLYFALLDDYVCHKIVYLQHEFRKQVIFEQAVLEIQKESFSKKVKLLRSSLERFGQYHNIPTVELERITDHLPELADHRNDIVHGWLRWDEEQKCLLFKNKDKTGRSTAAEDIQVLVDDLARWVIKFDGFFFRLVSTVADATP